MAAPTIILLKGALRDRISLFYATLFPIGLLIGLGIAFPSQDYRARLLPLVLALGILCFTFLGLMVGNLAQNEGQAALLNNLITLPMIFASEAFYSLSGAPDWLKALSHVLPFGYFVDAVRSALSGDAAGLVAPCAILLGYTALTLALAAVTFRWDPDGGVRRGALKIA
jgi:ABC-2 type transport system permease protein